MERERAARLRDAALLATAPLLAAAVFAPSLAGGFVHDDHRQIVGNPLVQSLSHLPALFSTGVWAGAGSGSSWYRPLMMSSFAFDRALLGPAPLGFHAIQLALWALVVALAVLAMRRFGASGAAVLIAGALGALHPAQAEAVAWISARCDLLVAAAGLASLLCYDRALVSSARHRRALSVAAGVAYLAALCGKESAVALAPLFVCIDRVRGAPMTPPAIAARHAPWLIGLGVYLALRAHGLGNTSGGLVTGMDPRLALAAFGQGAARILAPRSLTIAPPPPAPWHVGFGALVAIAAVAGGAVAFRRRSPLLVPIALGAGLLAIAALGATRVGEMADRYLVLPIFATAWLVAVGIESLPAAWRVAGEVAAAAVAVSFAVASATHVRVYANDEILWSDAWRKNPLSVRAASNLAALYLDRNEPYRAQEWLERASALAPGDPQVEMNRAVASEQMGDARAARDRLEALLISQPGYWPAALRAGHLALAAQDWAAAGRHYEAALRAYPLAAEAWAGLGIVREKQGRNEEARRAIERALAIDPQMENAEALRRLLARLGS